MGVAAGLRGSSIDLDGYRKYILYPLAGCKRWTTNTRINDTRKLVNSNWTCIRHNWSHNGF